MTVDPAVRRIGAGEWRTLRDVRLAALRDAPEAFGSVLERELAFGDGVWCDRAAANAAGEWIAGWFAELGGEVCGLAGGVACEEGWVELVGMWVSPAWRGRGVGRALIDAVCGWSARERGVGEVRLWVAAGNERAAAVYARCGFVATGARKPMPRRAGAEEIEMRRVLGV